MQNANKFLMKLYGKDEHFRFINLNEMFREIRKEIYLKVPELKKGFKIRVNYWLNSVKVNEPPSDFYLELHVYNKLLINDKVSILFKLRTIEIAEDIQSKGIGSRIIDILYSNAVKFGYDGFSVEHTENPILIKILNKYNFKKIDNELNYYKFFNH
ncbi:MAG: hypothetical protein ACM3UU_01405 [Ignavibacteriales bacterium]